MALLAAYAFDEGAGTTAAEASGGATITGVPGWAAGLHDDAMFSTSVGCNIDPFASDSAFTIMFDAYVVGSGGAGYNIFLSPVAGTGFGYFQVDGSGTLEWYSDVGASIGPLSGVTVPNTTWTHLAISADGTTRRIYRNAIDVGNVGNTVRSTTEAFYLLGYPGYTPNARMDNLRIYNTALTQPEIAALAGTAVVGGAAPASLLIPPARRLLPILAR